MATLNYLDYALHGTTDYAYAYTLNDGDSLYVAATGSITETGQTAHAADLEQITSATIAGSLFSTGATLTGGNDIAITVTATGSLLSATTHAIDENFEAQGAPYTFNLNNAGTIIGHNGSIYAFVETASIINSGTISDDAASTSGSVINFYNVNLDTLVGTNTLQNTGTISSVGAGSTILVHVGSTPSTVYNSGAITSTGGTSYTGNAGIDSIYNDGKIYGDIHLGDGNDGYYGSAGTLHGIVFGEGGDDVLTGSATVGTVFDGGAGADAMTGGSAIDTAAYIDSTAGVTANLAHPELNTGDAAGDTYTSIEDLLGGFYNDMLVGDDNANYLSGLNGADTMIGGLGNDIYVVDNIGDVVVENANEGTDLVHASISYTLPDNVERLILDGTAAINGTGNALANIITGNSGANALDGGAGADILIGGAGNDTYYVDNAGDMINEAGPATDIDLVHATVSWTLGANLENLTLDGTANINGTGNALANVITGNGGNNVIDGGAGADTMIGGQGNDTYYVDNVGDVVTEAANAGTDTVHATISYTLPANVENLVLDGTANINATGNALANILTGNSGANLLNGLTGADTMIGGQGNDIYVVENPNDVVVENANEGTDLIHAYVTYTLPANVERLSLEGTGSINGTGNALANIINGNTGNNILTGGGGADIFVELKGFAQDTIMDFAAGSAAGHDTIQLSSAEFANYAAVIADAHQSGSDTVIQSGTDVLTLHGVTLGNLVSGDFIFV